MLPMIYVIIFSCMTEEIRILIHKQSSTKHILNTYGGVMQYKIYCIYIIINIYFRVCVRIFNR